MLRHLFLFSCAISLLLLNACSGHIPSPPLVFGPTLIKNPSTTPSLTPFAPLENTLPSAPTFPSVTSPITLSPTSTKPFSTTQASSLPDYFFYVVLDYAIHTISVDETINYTNSTGQILSDLVLAIEPNLWKNCYVQGALTVDGHSPGSVNLDAERLTIQLNNPLPAYGSLSIFVHYDLHLPFADKYHIFGYNDFQTNLVDWYPFIVPFIPGKGWILHPPAQVGEHLTYAVETFDMTLRMADPSQPTVIAASTPPEKVLNGWHFHLEKARSFAFSVSDKYQFITSNSNNVTIMSYFFSEDAAQGQRVRDEVEKASRTFTVLFGPNFYPALSIVESPFFDGMEYDGLFFLSRDFYEKGNGTVLGNLVDIAVHETAHQWWFGSVGNDQAMAPWLDEALATYSESLFYEQNYPEVSAWQAYRIDAYSPTGWVDTDIYHGVDFRTYANAVYLRGAEFLQSVREKVGDETFFAFMKDYASQMSGRLATPEDFFRILRKHSNADLSDIIYRYFQQRY